MHLTAEPRTLLVAAALLFAVASCGDAGIHPVPPDAPEVGKLTVSNSACGYESLRTPHLGPVTVVVVDQTGGGFNAHLWLLDSGYDYSDWARGFLTDHATLRDHAHIVDHANVKPGATQRFTTHFDVGTYAFLCVPLRDGSEYGVGYTAGPIKVTS